MMPYAEVSSHPLRRALRAEAARPFLETLVARFAPAPHQIGLDCDPDLRVPAAELELLGEAAAEAISNALQHAFPPGRAGRVWLRLARERGRLNLTIRDNGIGMPDLSPDPDSGRGRIAAVAEALGGYARLGSAQFGGSIVLVSYPSPAAA